MNPRSQPAHSYLFTVRLWWEDLGDGQWEWRGVVKLVTSGEEHFFRDWETLGQLLKDKILTSVSETAPSKEHFGD